MIKRFGKMNLSNKKIKFKKEKLKMNIKAIERKMKKDGIEVVNPQDGTLQIWDVLEDDYIQIEVISTGEIEIATENSSITVDTYKDMIKEILEYIIDEL